MRAHSTRTGKSYDSWDDLVDVKASGYSVVSILQHTNADTGRIASFARVVGPFSDKAEARKKAASLRRQWRRLLVADNETHVMLLSVSVEPIWSELDLNSTTD